MCIIDEVHRNLFSSQRRSQLYFYFVLSYKSLLALFYLLSDESSVCHITPTTISFIDYPCLDDGDVIMI